jgi:hypothetical protein
VQPVAPAQQGARVERAQVQRPVVEHPLGLRVGGVVHLEAAVEQHAVDLVGAHPAADHRLRLEQRHLEAGAGQVQGAGQPARPAPTTTTSGTSAA